MDESIIMHVKVHNLTIEAARLANPKWTKRPLMIIVPPQKSAVVYAASSKALQAGIQRGMPVHEARRSCPEALCISRDEIDCDCISKKLFSLLSDVSPRVHKMGPGEAYINLEGCQRMYGAWSAKPLGHTPFSCPTSGTYIRLANRAIPVSNRELPPAQYRWITALGIRLQQKVATHMGMSLSVGCSDTTLAAQCASDYLKNGGVILIHPDTKPAFFRLLPMKDLPGIGTNILSKFAKWNVQSTAEAQKLPQHILCQAFGNQRGQNIYRLLRGQQDDTFSSVDAPQSISRERTFWDGANDPSFVEGMLHHLVEMVGKKLREDGLSAGTIRVKLRYQDAVTRQKCLTLKRYTNENRKLFRRARQQLHKCWTPNHRVRTIGFTVSNLTHSDQKQTDLFNQQDNRHRKLDRCVDDLRKRFGFDIVHRGPSIQLKTSVD